MSSSIVEYFINSGKIPQSIILEGRDSNRCFEQALYIASRLLCKLNDSANIVKISQNIHPDLFIVEVQEKSKSIKIDQIRGLKDFYSLSPQIGSKKVIIVRDANFFTEEAGNALLKILEEPIEQRYFILTVQNRNLLLSTVVSRCICIKVKSSESKDPKYNSDVGELLPLFQNIDKKDIFYADIYDTLEKFSNLNSDKYLSDLIYLNSSIFDDSEFFEGFRLNIIESLLNLTKLVKLNISSRNIISLFALYLSRKNFKKGVIDFE